MPPQGHQPTGAERRTAARIDLEVEVDFHTEHNFYTGLTQDISHGGLFVSTHQIRRVGDRMTVRFKLPGHPQAIETEVEVRWVREAAAGKDFPSGMGLHFLDLSPDARFVIMSFIRKRESLFFDDE